MNPHAHAMRLLALAAVAIVASLVFGNVAQAAPPSPPDQMVFDVRNLDVTEAAEPVSGCSKLPLFSAQKRAGTASACFSYVFGVPYVTWFSAVITLHLHGGTITMVTAPPNDGTTSCLHGWVDGFPLSYARLNCSGPITSAKGIFAGHAGVVTYDWWYVFDYGSGLRSWLQPPTITIDFS